MKEITLGNYEYISLGWNCCIKRVIQEIFKVKKETQFFDYLGTPMWAINKLFENDFENFGDLKFYETRQILSTFSNLKIHKDYYIRPMHDLDDKIRNKPKNTKNFGETYLRRKNRLYDYLNSGKKIMFMRLEENMVDRKIYDEYKNFYSIKESEHLVKFSKIIKEKFCCEFYILFFTTEENRIDKNNNIIFINIPIETFKRLNWTNCIQILYKILDENKDFIRDFLR